MNNITLSDKQFQGLLTAVKRYDDHEKYTVIAGYAGTGKSTLVTFITEGLKAKRNIKEEDIVYTSYTGKACQVLQAKGHQNVSTLHKLLYTFYPRPNGSFVYRAVESIPYKIVIVDEISMVPKNMIELLFSHSCYVICLGDPFQLPPVDTSANNHLLDKPHVFLDEIMRQGLDSDIIRLSMEIRTGTPIKSSNYDNSKEVKIIPQSKLTRPMLAWADQIICATNKARQGLNTTMRDYYGRTGGPGEGDKLICIQNYWDVLSDTDDYLVNGTIGTISNIITDEIQLPRKFNFLTIPVIQAHFDADGFVFHDLIMDTKLITEGKPSLSANDKYHLYNYNKWLISKERLPITMPREFLYGYAITCHKAQGSEWDKGVIIEEKFPYNKEEHARWLYTAVTRFSKRVILVNWK